MDPAYWKHLIRPVFTGRRWLLVRDLLVAATSDAELLHFYAAEKSFAIAGSEATDGKGRGGGHMMVSRQQKETVSHDIVFAAGGAARLAVDDETPDATLEFGPGPQGGFVRLDLDPGRAEFGPPAAPRAAAAFMLADELWDLGVGELEPAPELR